MSETVGRMFFMTQGFGESVRADRLLASAGAAAAGSERVEELRKQLAASYKEQEGRSTCVVICAIWTGF